MEEAHEAYFRRALGIGAVVTRAIEHKRPRRARSTVGAEGDLVEEPRRHRASTSGLEVDIEHLGLHFPGRRGKRGDQRRALAGDNVIEFQFARADLRQILVKPFGQRGVEVGDVALRIDREEASGRMVEIVDGVLQLLEGIFLALEFAGYVRDRPDGCALLTLAVAERPHAHAQPPSLRARLGADAHLLLQTSTLARRFKEAVDRLRHAGIADESALDRLDVACLRVGEIEVGRVGVNDSAVGVGNEDAVDSLVEDGLEQRASGVLTGRPQDAGGQRKQQEHTNRRQHGQQREYIGLTTGPADQEQPDAGAHQNDRDQQHHADAAALLAGAAAVDG